MPRSRCGVRCAGLRKIEQAVLKQPNSEESTSLTQNDPGATVTMLVGRTSSMPAPEADSAGAVVLAYCAAVRGILNQKRIHRLWR